MLKKVLFYFSLWLLSTTNLVAQCLNASSKYFAPEAISSTSGNVELDRVIRSEYYILSQTFQLQTDFYFGGDSYGAGQAFFQSTNQCSSPGCVGLVVVGRYLLAEQLQKKYGLEKVKAILAHEFGHAIQSKMGWHGNGYAKWKELHADFMAGFYMAQKAYITEELLGSFIQEFYDRGDFEFYNPDHHGTPNERGCAFREGFGASRRFNLSVYGAFQSGVVYLSDLLPCNPLTQAHINTNLNQVNGYNGLTDLSYYDPSLVVAAAAIVGAAYLTYATINYFDEVTISIQPGFLRNDYSNLGILQTLDLFKTFRNKNKLFLSAGGTSDQLLGSVGYFKHGLFKDVPTLYLGGGLQFYGPTDKNNFPLFLAARNDHIIKGGWTFSERMYLSRDIATLGVALSFKYKNRKKKT